MLVITRKLNQKIQIGDNITVHVVEIQEGKVFLNITLPSRDIKSEITGLDEEIEITEEVKVKIIHIQGRCQVKLGIASLILITKEITRTCSKTRSSSGTFDS